MRSHCLKHRFFHKLKHTKGVWFHLAGIICFLWFVIRVLPAPHRSQYPCQQMAMPIAFGYIAFWSAMVYGLVQWMHHMKTKTASFTPLLLIIVLLVTSISGIGFAGSYQSFEAVYEPWNPIANLPMGTGTGIFSGRVVWTWNPDATEEDLTGYWWQDHNNNPSIVSSMMSEGLQALTNTSSDEAAWHQLFTFFNEQHEKGTIGYQPGEKIAIKVNLNNCWNPVDNIDDYVKKDNERDAHPLVVKTILSQLVNTAGVAPEDITVYDSSRPMPNWFYEPLAEKYPTVHYVDKRGEAPGRSAAQASNVTIHFADGLVRTLPNCVAEASYLINMPLLKQHPINHGVTLSGKNMFGTFLEPVMELHPYHRSGQIMGNAAPQTDLLAHEEIGQKTLLYLGDGLYATLRDHRTITRFSMYPFNDDWTNSLFFSQDPVAIDSVMYDFLHTEGPIPLEGSQNYVHQAAEPLPDTYDPEADGTYLSESLGVHEHWNTNTSIFSPYRYLGSEGSGIDFVAVGESHSTQDIVITCPAQDSLYIFNEEQSLRIFYQDYYKYPATIIIGPITINTSINGISNEEIDYVDFCIDGKKKHTDDHPPFQWKWSSFSFGIHTITVTAWIDETPQLTTERTVLRFF